MNDKEKRGQRSRTPHPPIMQDLSDSNSPINQVFSRFTAPTVPFEPAGPWRHVYQDLSFRSLKHPQGGLTIKHRPGGNGGGRDPRVAAKLSLPPGKPCLL